MTVSTAHYSIGVSELNCQNGKKLCLFVLIMKSHKYYILPFFKFFKCWVKKGSEEKKGSMKNKVKLKPTMKQCCQHKKWILL